jgi:DNA-binding CsgD family transcriptional regulator
MSWAAEGKSDSVIAEILGVSHSTVRFHMNNVFKKLNANERTLATVKAIRHGLILPSFIG